MEKAGIDVEYFTVVGKGLKGYLKNVMPLTRHIRQKKYDVVHAHYSLSALTATLAGCRPLVVSLMGSDIRLGFVFRQAVSFSSLFFWESLIVKSKDMQDNIRIKYSEIIPNGIDTDIFRPIEKKTARGRLGWNQDKRHILFAANPSRAAKNFQLAERAMAAGVFRKAELHVLGNVPHHDIPVYMNASDVVILTSLWEGSPNVVKEAMACNCSVVATDVGDIRWLFGDEQGYFLTSFDPADVAYKMKMALDFAMQKGKTHGRERMIELGLDSESVARRIISVYERVVGK